MPQVHVDEETATLIAEALHAGWTYPQIKQKGITNSDPQISLIKKEMEAQRITIDQDGRAVIHDFGVVVQKGINIDPTTGKKKENRLPTDKEFIRKAAGLDTSQKVRKEIGTKDSSKIMETQTKFLTTQLQVVQHVGVFMVNMIREKADLTEEELNDPDLQSKKLIEHIKASNILSQDTHALDRLTAEYAYMKTAVQNAEHLLTVMQNGFDIASKVMCDDCRKQTFYALSLQAKKPPKPELTQAIPNKDEPAEGIQ